MRPAEPRTQRSGVSGRAPLTPLRCVRGSASQPSLLNLHFFRTFLGERRLSPARASAHESPCMPTTTLPKDFAAGELLAHRRIAPPADTAAGGASHHSAGVAAGVRAGGHRPDHPARSGAVRRCCGWSIRPCLACRTRSAPSSGALNFLGLKSVRSLVLSLSLPSLRGTTGSEERWRECWKASVAAAIVAREFAVQRPARSGRRPGGLPALRPGHVGAATGLPGRLRHGAGPAARRAGLQPVRAGRGMPGADPCRGQRVRAGALAAAARDHRADPPSSPASGGPLAGAILGRAMPAALPGDASGAAPAHCRQQPAGPGPRGLAGLACDQFGLSEGGFLGVLGSLHRKIDAFTSILQMDLGRVAHYPSLVANASVELVRLSVEPRSVLNHPGSPQPGSPQAPARDSLAARWAAAPVAASPNQPPDYEVLRWRRIVHQLRREASARPFDGGVQSGLLRGVAAPGPSAGPAARDAAGPAGSRPRRLPGLQRPPGPGVRRPGPEGGGGGPAAAAVQPEAIVARWGADEFSIVIPEASADCLRTWSQRPCGLPSPGCWSATTGKRPRFRPPSGRRWPGHAGRVTGGRPASRRRPRPGCCPCRRQGRNPRLDPAG